MAIRISIIAPIFSEEKGIPQLAEKLDALRQRLEPSYETEFVLVDDGSFDATLETVRKYFASTPRFRLVTHGRNCGAGAAIRTGFQNATGEILCTIDADCTFDPLDLPKLIWALEQQDSDIAVGSPYHPQGGVENVVPWRLLISRGCSWLYRRVTQTQLYSYTSFLRVYRRRVVETISFEADGFVAVTEILVRALHRGFRVVEVPVVLRRRLTGVSKMNVVWNTLTHLCLASQVLKWRFAARGGRTRAAETRNPARPRALLKECESAAPSDLPVLDRTRAG